MLGIASARTQGYLGDGKSTSCADVSDIAVVVAGMLYGCPPEFKKRVLEKNAAI